MEFKGTKGKWNAMSQITQGVWVEGEAPLPALICRIHGETCDEKFANAQLIASAPELLEACIEFVRKCDNGTARSKKSYTQMTIAINKALGK